MTGLRVRFDADIARQAQISARIARAQADISSGKRLQSASDDPAATARVGQLRNTQTSEAAWLANINAGSALAARVDGTLTTVASLLDRARELATTAASDTLSNADRGTIALELRSLASEVDSLSTGIDASGQRIFPTTPLALPVGSGLTLTATTSRSDAFDVAGRDIATLLRDAATGIAAGGAARATALSDIGTAVEHVAVVRGEHGARAARLDAMLDRLVDSAASISEERSALEDTDLPATIARAQADQLSLDAAQASFARINRRTLFDLLG